MGYWLRTGQGDYYLRTSYRASNSTSRPSRADLAVHDRAAMKPRSPSVAAASHRNNIRTITAFLLGPLHPVLPPRQPPRVIGANSQILLLKQTKKTTADAPRCSDDLLARYRTGWTVARQRATQRMRSCGASPAAANIGCTHRRTMAWPLTRQ